MTEESRQTKVAPSKPTDAQRRAIESRKRRVIVTASAGSGKTSAMISRVLSLITEEKARLSSVVMLTFTEAAAEEMKTRLAIGLFDAIKRAEGAERSALIHAFEGLPLFRCGTIDSFCYRLVKSHFEMLGISPAASLMDETEAENYRTRAFRALMDEKFAEDPEGYFSLLSAFDGDADKISEGIMKVYLFAETTEDPTGFLDRAEKIAEGGYESSPAMQDFFKRVAKEARLTKEKMTARDLSFPAEAERLAAARDKLLTALDAFIAARNMDDLSYAKDISALPSIGKEGEKFSEAGARYEEIKLLFTAFRDGVSKLTYGSKGLEALKEGLTRSHEETRALIQATKRFKEIYAKLKEDARLLDFADVEHGALSLLNDQGVASEIGCDYLLVDECQDLNPLQDALMRRIVGEKDLFMVGDVKQSIYRFRLSDPQLFRRRVEEGRSDPEQAEVVDFAENFRSSDAVVDFVNGVFGDLMTEKFGGERYLPATRGGRHAGSGEVACLFYPKQILPPESASGVYSVAERWAAQEAARPCPEGEWVRDRIRDLVGKPYRSTKNDEVKTLTYRDIAILSPKKMRPGSLQEQVIETLRRAGIPVNVGEFVKDKEYAEIQAIVDFLRLIESPSDDYAFLSVLRSDLFSFPLTRLAEISLTEGDTFVEKARKRAAEGDADLKEVFDYLDEMRFLSGALSLYELVSRLIDDKMRLTVLKKVDGRKIFGEILTFAESLKTGGATGSISEYIPYFDKYYRVREGGEVTESDAITVSSIHASKGLEYPVVFVIGLGDAIVGMRDKSESVRADKAYGVIKKPASGDTFEIEQFKRKKEQELKEDKLRLLYVALTRAKNNLYLTGAIPTLDAVAKEEAESLAEWILPTASKLGVPLLDDYRSPASEERERESGAANADPTDLAKLSAAFAYAYPHEKATKTSIKFTVTAINEREEEEQPAEIRFAEEKRAKGTAFHAAMEHLPFSVKSEAETSSLLNKLVEEGIIEAGERADLSAHAVFGAIKGVRELVGNKQVFREKSFLLRLSAREAGVADLEDRVVVQGKIDLLALGEGEATVVDYKLSSQPAPLLVERYKGQLDLYAQAVKRGFGVSKVHKYIFVLGRNEKISIDS